PKSGELRDRPSSPVAGRAPGPFLLSRRGPARPGGGDVETGPHGCRPTSAKYPTRPATKEGRGMRGEGRGKPAPRPVPMTLLRRATPGRLRLLLAGAGRPG